MIRKFDEFIKESYNNIGLIKSRSNYYMINESQESKSQSEAKKYIRDNNKFNWSESEIDNFIRVKLRNDITSLRDKQIGKFTLGVTRMYFNNEITDASTISKLNSTLKLLSAHLNEYDRNLNGLSSEELISKFEQARENNVKKEKNEINRMKFGVSDYEIVRIDSFSEAKKYYSYTNPHSRWCLTHDEEMFDSYTCGGINQIYFCLKNGFEDIDQIDGDDVPLDEYGLSMLSVIVNEEGELAYCTTRWNHDNGGDDSAMNAVEISKVVNVNFYETFKPNTKWKDAVDNVKRRLDNGDDINEIFDDVDEFEDGITKVELNNRYNFINKNGEFLFDRWYDFVGEFKDGYAKVMLSDRYNFINKNGEFLSDRWYNYIGDFKDGYAIVKLNNKYNLINNIDGKPLFDEWYDCIYNYKNDYARVKLNTKYNFINTKGKLVSDKWYDSVEDFKDGFAKVFLSGKGNNFINKNGEYKFDEWYDHIEDFKDGYAKVKIIKNYKKIIYNFINIDGKLVSDEWYDEVYNFKNGYAEVKLNGKYNFINKEIKLVSDEWYDDAGDFRDGYLRVKLNGKYNFINKEIKLVFDEWYDDAGEFKDGYAKVKLNGKYNLINKKIKLVFDEWYDDIKDFKGYASYAEVKLNGKYNLINRKRELVSDEGYDYIGDFKFGYALVELNDKYNFINEEGKIMLDKWFYSVYDSEYYRKRLR